MKKDTRNFVIVLAVLVAILVGGNIAVRESSGVDPPFTVVESQSMQHGNGSEIGIIDTGDMVLVKSPSKTDIVSYVEGYHSGYRSFGEYGSVIVYERSIGNPVIHRAILWLESNGDGTWSAESLKYYTDDGSETGTRMWSCGLYNDYLNMSGTLTLYDVGYAGKIVSINLDTLDNGRSGYLTMGDNAVTNRGFDQVIGVYGDLVAVENIRSVAWVEIPWLGSLKLMINGNTSALDTWASNSIGYLAVAFVTVIMVLMAIGYTSDCLHIKKAKKR